MDALRTVRAASRGIHRGKSLPARGGGDNARPEGEFQAARARSPRAVSRQEVFTSIFVERGRRLGSVTCRRPCWIDAAIASPSISAERRNLRS